MLNLRFLNKITNEELNISVLTELQANEYLKKLNSDWVKLPIDDKKYIFQDGEIIEKPVDIEKIKTEKISEIESAYTKSFLNGFDTSIGVKFHIKPEDQLNYIGAMIATQSMQDTDILPFPVIDFNGAAHQITVGQARQTYSEIVTYKAQMETKRATLLGQIVNVQTLEELNSVIIDYSDL